MYEAFQPGIEQETQVKRQDQKLEPEFSIYFEHLRVKEFIEEEDLDLLEEVLSSADLWTLVALFDVCESIEPAQDTLDQDFDDFCDEVRKEIDYEFGQLQASHSLEDAEDVVDMLQYSESLRIYLLPKAEPFFLTVCCESDNSEKVSQALACMKQAPYVNQIRLYRTILLKGTHIPDLLPQIGHACIPKEGDISARVAFGTTVFNMLEDESMQKQSTDKFPSEWIRDALIEELHDEDTKAVAGSLLFSLSIRAQKKNNFELQDRQLWPQETVDNFFDEVEEGVFLDEETIFKEEGLYHADAWVIDLANNLTHEELDGMGIARVEERITAFGLDGKKVFGDWKESFSAAWYEYKNEKYKRGDFAMVIRKNFFAMREIMKEVGIPGLQTLFSDFGISNFGRYNVQTLVEQVRHKDDTEKPYGIVIFPQSDWNGAFYDDGTLLENFRQELVPYGVGLKIIECKSKVRVFSRLEHLDEQYNSNGANKMRFLIVGGHGSHERIQFGERNASVDYIGLNDFDMAQSAPTSRQAKAIEKTKSMFAPDMPIALFSCSTASLDFGDNVARRASEVYETNVVGPMSDTVPRAIQVYEENGKLQIQVDYKQKARAFYRGQ